MVLIRSANSNVLIVMLKFKKSIDIKINFIAAHRLETIMEFNLDIDYLKSLWSSQSGLCHYTSVPMKWTKGKVSFYSPSLDKLNPSKGYIKGNVVFCLFAVNSFKQELTYVDFLKFVHSTKWKAED